MVSPSDIVAIMAQAQTAARPKDLWDKVQIVGTVMSSVVVAVAALVISAAIQRAQIRSAEIRSAADRISEERRAEAEKTLKESQLAATLLEHLASTSDVQRELAIAALQWAVPAPIHDSVLQILARSDRSSGVREAAISQLASSQTSSVVPTLERISTDDDRSVRERQLAAGSVSSVSIANLQRTGGSAPSVVFASTGNAAIMAGESGLSFSAALIKGLAGGAADDDGRVTVGSLYEFVKSERLPDGKAPFLHMRNISSDPPLISTRRDYEIVQAVVVGGVETAGITDVPRAAESARRFADLLASRWRGLGADLDIRLLIGSQARRMALAEGLASFGTPMNRPVLRCFYFCGYMLPTSGGELAILTADSVVDEPDTWYPFREVARRLEEGGVSLAASFLDAQLMFPHLFK